MDENIDFLYSEAMKLLLERASKTKQFSTHEEYIKNIGIISGSTGRVEKKPLPEQKNNKTEEAKKWHLQL